MAALNVPHAASGGTGVPDAQVWTEVDVTGRSLPTLRSPVMRWVSYLFTNDEVFYEFQDQNWFRNRFRAGMNITLTDRTDVDVFYNRQDSNNATPGAINALGLTFDVTFK
jgi:hypothetical protein